MNPADEARATRALLAGNFAIGCGVMVVPGGLNDIALSLQVPVPVAGQLVSAAALAMGLGAPLLAALLGGFDRRRLLAWSLAWYALGHALAALAPSFAALLPLRVVGILAAAVFTPQAAAAIGTLVAPERRGRAITTVFLGWSLASVLGMPLHSYIAEALGWRWAFALTALLALAGAAAVWRALPDGVRPPQLSRRDWRAVFTSPLLMGAVAVTALSAAGQFTVFSYFAPYFRQQLGFPAAAVAGLFLWFGAFGLVGNLVVVRVIDRRGAATSVNVTLALIAVALLAWPLTRLAAPWGAGAAMAATAAVLVPWALGCFSSNSAQQARLAGAAPAYAPALLALNTSAMYAGQALGAGGGGALLAGAGWAPLPWAGFAWVCLALACSLWVARRLRHSQ